MSPAERVQLVQGWNDTRRPYPRRSLPGIFQEVAARQPGAPAVLYHDGELTYAGLANLDRKSVV